MQRDSSPLKKRSRWRASLLETLRNIKCQIPWERQVDVRVIVRSLGFFFLPSQFVATFESHEKSRKATTFTIRYHEWNTIRDTSCVFLYAIFPRAFASRCTRVRVIRACKLVARRNFVCFSRNVDYLLPLTACLLDGLMQVTSLRRA